MYGKNDNQHYKHALKVPAQMYREPQDVLEDGYLSQEQKRQVLENWACEIQRALFANKHGICSDEGSACEEELLQKIARSFDYLD